METAILAADLAADDRIVSIQTLLTLENAIEPYRQAGYVIIFQSDSAITLRPPSPKFAWGRFMLGLFLLWPLAVVYLIRFNQWRDRCVCVRLTSQGQIEATGFTLDLLETEGRRQFLST
jgi:predicted membrane metal-binding protein